MLCHLSHRVALGETIYLKITGIWDMPVFSAGRTLNSRDLTLRDAPRIECCQLEGSISGCVITNGVVPIWQDARLSSVALVGTRMPVGIPCRRNPAQLYVCAQASRGLLSEFDPRTGTNDTPTTRAAGLSQI